MKQIDKYFAHLIHCPERARARERVTVKARLLFDYLKPPMNPGLCYEGWAAGLAGSRTLRPFPNDPHVVLDEEGELACVQPYAEIFLLESARFFGGALGLILMAETCYGSTVAEPGQLNTSLVRFRALVSPGGLTPAALLHEFLEVDDDISAWFAGLLQRLNTVAGRDYVALPPGDGSAGGGGFGLSPMMAARAAAITPTIRGRKMRACLVEPGVTPIDLDQNAPDLLELLFTPPARGLTSL